MGAFWKAAVATAAYGAFHSLVAAGKTKQAAARRLGHRHRAGLYRPFYIVQSLVTFGALAVYIRTLPREELYRVEGAPRAVMRAGQGAAMVWATLAAGSVGVLDITGLRNFAVWLTGGDPGPEPEAQGPALREDDEMHVTGPFRFSRHPLNVAPFVIFGLQPTMTSRFLGFTATSAVYLVLGSVHEEQRLKAAYGAPYQRYTGSDVPFYMPGKRRRSATPITGRSAGA